MPTDAVLIPSPVLDPRTERARIAARLDRTVGNYTREDAEQLRDAGEDIIALIDEGHQTDVEDRLAPELTSVRPAEAHVALLTEMELSVIQLQYALNLLPEQNRIALYRILGITLQAATPATCTLFFTRLSGFSGQVVTIPAGTVVATEDRAVRVATDEELTINAGGPGTGRVPATATTAGDIGRVPAGTLGLLLQSVAGVASVVNSTDLAGGRNDEPTSQAEIRAREGMRRGNHLTTAQDWVDFIYFETIRRRGRVTAFEGFLYDFTKGGLGYTLLVAQDERGLAISEGSLQAISTLIAERHVAGIQITARSAEYREFSIRVAVSVRTGASPGKLTGRAKNNLIAFFSPLTFPYGPAETDRVISLSDIVGQVEGAGNDLISVITKGNQFAVAIVVDGLEIAADFPLLIGELPALQSVEFKDKDGNIIVPEG